MMLSNCNSNPKSINSDGGESMSSGNTTNSTNNCGNTTTNTNILLPNLQRRSSLQRVNTDKKGKKRNVSSIDSTINAMTGPANKKQKTMKKKIINNNPNPLSLPLLSGHTTPISPSSNNYTFNIHSHSKSNNNFKNNSNNHNNHNNHNVFGATLRMFCFMLYLF